jgi:hypothetical protein
MVVFHCFDCDLALFMFLGESRYGGRFQTISGPSKLWAAARTVGENSIMCLVNYAKMTNRTPK